MFIRKSASSLTGAEQTAFVAAVLELKTKPSLMHPGDQTRHRYDDFVEIHLNAIPGRSMCSTTTAWATATTPILPVRSSCPWDPSQPKVNSLSPPLESRSCQRWRRPRGLPCHGSSWRARSPDFVTIQLIADPREARGRGKPRLCVALRRGREAPGPPGPGVGELDPEFRPFAYQGFILYMYHVLLVCARRRG